MRMSDTAPLVMTSYWLGAPSGLCTDTTSSGKTRSWDES